MSISIATARALRVFVADGDPAFALSVRTAIDADPRLDLVGIATNDVQALSLTSEFEPEVVVIDLQLPGADLPEVIRRIGEVSPEVRVVALTDKTDMHAVAAAHEAGAVGFVRRDEPARVVAAILDLASLIIGLGELRAG